MKILREILMKIGTLRLFARVGLPNITPRKAYQMVRYWLATALFGRKIPWLVELSVTYRCQCKCPHCSVGIYLDQAAHKNELNSEQIKSILRQAAQMGIPKVDFFGGEPLLKEDIVELTRYGAKLGLYMSMTTNAWLLSKEMTRKLKQAGISCINISLDSVDAGKHDSLRGLPGLYAKAVDGVRYCHTQGIPCIVSTYITRNRIKNFGQASADDSQLTKIINLAKDLKASAIRVLFPIISGRWEKDQEKEFTEAEKLLVIDNLDTSFAFIEGAFSVCHKKKVCQSLRGKMFNISPYGDVQLCVTFPDSFGNAKDTSLKQVLAQMYSHPVYLKNKDGSCCSTAGLKRQ